ncbi:MAG: Hsp20/alpha crystallin family protein [Bythopirellula sp.]|nr:Hsp20/alpha crystallin family protein [Bythopirellula sp.]
MTNCPTPKNRLRDFVPANLADFDAFLNQVLSPSHRTGHTSAGLWEDETAYHIELDVPGVQRENVDVTFDKGALTIATERKHDETTTDRKGWREERFYGKVTRLFTLPETIDVESIAAELTDGVLRVTVAKSPAAQPRKVEIK